MDCFCLFTDFVQQRDNIGSRLSSSVLGPGDNAFPLLDDRNRLFLDGSGYGVAILIETQQQLLVEIELSERLIFGWFDVLN